MKGTGESVARVDSSVPLMHHDPIDLGSLIRIRITSEERARTLTSGKLNAAIQIYKKRNELGK